jgi:bifunctional UDP-N-acetylglucosamine pyrophosphorylase/glucosamine-1-phosphate N-acetyltransferase
MPLYAIVLAAGEGTRMRSQRPKPLHPICGRPMVMHVIHSLDTVQPTQTIVVVGFGADQVKARISHDLPDRQDIRFADQRQQRGTGDAVSVGLGRLDEIIDDEIDDTSTIVVVPGDTPLLRKETIDDLVTHHETNALAATVLVSHMEDPTGYGRVVRAKDGRVVRIVEHRDASPDELAIHEINTSIYAFRRDLLGPALRHVSPQNSQAEYYLTDVISVLAGMGHRVGAVPADSHETQGVNDRWQLALAERELRARTNRRWLLNGVTMFDPRQTFIDIDVQIGQDVSLLPGTVLQGRTVIGSGSEIGPNARLVDCTVGRRSIVDSTVAVDAVIGDDAHIGPFAHLVPGTRIADGRRTGAFYDSSKDDSVIDGRPEHD